MAAGDDTKGKLLAVARDLYLEHGLLALSLREVARRVGVAPSAVYRHFENKEALVAEVCVAGFRVFGAYLMRALEARDPRARMLAAAREYRRFGLENPRDYRVMFMGAAEEYEALGVRRQPSPDPTFQFLVDRVHECQAAKIVHRGDAIEIAAVIWAHVHGLVSLRLAGHFSRLERDADFDHFFDVSSERLLAGLAP